MLFSLLVSSFFSLWCVCIYVVVIVVVVAAAAAAVVFFYFLVEGCLQGAGESTNPFCHAPISPSFKFLPYT